jgi:hypothetical protein
MLLSSNRRQPLVVSGVNGPVIYFVGKTERGCEREACLDGYIPLLRNGGVQSNIRAGISDANKHIVDPLVSHASSLLWSGN